jgi:mannose-6-phosphate isomerase-like protein (cupin superfamily)
MNPVDKILGNKRLNVDLFGLSRTVPKVGTPYHGNIEKQTKENNNYRNVIATEKNSQLVLMTLQPGQEIGNEVHPKSDQFFRIEQGTALFNLDNGKKNFTLGNGGAVIVPKGHWHNVTNTGHNLLKLYTVYSPATHKPGTLQKVRPKND